MFRSVRAAAASMVGWVVWLSAMVVAMVGGETARAQGCAAWQSGQGLRTIDGRVYAAAVWDPDGPGPLPEMVVIGGSFSIAGDVRARNLAAWDGERWREVAGGVGNAGDTVYAISVSGTDLVVGGRLRSAGGLSINNIARWDGASWQGLGDALGSGDVRALARYRGEIIASGTFSVPGMTGNGRVARWAGAAWEAIDTPSTAIGVNALFVRGDQLIVGGTFSQIGGVPAVGVAAWDGVSWTALGNLGSSSLFITLNGFAEFEGSLYACLDSAVTGGFRSVVRWTGAEWEPIGTIPDVTALHVYRGQLYAVGNATWVLSGGAWAVVGGLSVGGTSPLTYRDRLVVAPLALWDESSWSFPGGGAGAVGDVRALVSWNGNLIAGGPNLTGIGGVVARGVASWDGSAWMPMGRGLGGLQSLTTAGGDLYATSFLGDAIAWRWTGNRWAQIGLFRGGAGVGAVAPFRGGIVVSGSFSRVDAVPAANIARWDGASWLPMGSGISGSASAFVEHNGDLYIGGNFTFADPVTGTAFYLARWDGAAWRAVGSGPIGVVNALASYRGDLIAGGNFTRTDGGVVRRIARWDGQAWSPLGSGFDGAVNALGEYGGDLIASGQFSTADGQAVNRIARWDGSRWRPLDGGLGDGAAALAVYRNELIVGGSFLQAGSLVSARWARWRDAAGDANADNAVDFTDLVAVLAAYGASGPPGAVRGDVNNDGVVNMTDLSLVLANYGSACSP